MEKVDQATERRMRRVRIFQLESVQKLSKVAFVAVVVSTLAVVSAIVSLPIAYNYVQSLQTHLYARVDECRVCLTKKVFKTIK